MSHPINPISTFEHYDSLTERLSSYGITLDDRRITNNYDDTAINTFLLVNSHWHQVRGGVQIDLLLAGGEQFIIWDTFTVQIDDEYGVSSLPLKGSSFARSVWSVSPVKYHQATGKSLAMVNAEFVASCSGQGSLHSDLWEFGERLDNESAYVLGLVVSDYNLPLWITRGFQVVSDWMEEIRRS